MSDLAKKVVLASMVVAGIVLIAAVLDLISGFPFAGQSMALDIVFILTAAIVGYLGYDALSEAK